ncbi:MAG: TonB-dependent receptor domain-containing protein [Bacteroidota bacterium]
MLRKLLFSFLAICLGMIVNAQVTTSSITGSVKGQDGKSLEGASVKITNTSNGSVKYAKSDKKGLFNVPNLDPGGPYNVSVTYVGLSFEEKKDVYLQLGTTENFELVGIQTGVELQDVVINGRANRTIKTGTSTNFNQRVINSLPNISRNISSVTTLVPQAGGGSSFGGRDGRYNNIQLDGANFNNNFGLSSNPLPGGAIQPISIDAIDEISVNISPFDVRQANFTGAGINATTKRGTNKFRGSVYGFFRDQSLLGTNAVGQKIPTVTQSSSQTVGAVIGGPIIKNKLFFFVSVEQVEISQPGLVWKASRPGVTPDANTTRVRGSALDSVSDYLKKNYGYETGPYENLGNYKTTNQKVLGRLDWIINSKHSLSFRYNYSKTDDDQTLNGNSAPNPRSSTNRWSNNSMSFQNSNYQNTNLLELYALEFKSNFNSKFSNQFIATYTKANDPKRSSNSKPFPFIDIWEGGVNYISAGYELFSWNNDVQNNTLTFNNNITYTTGKHSITAGAAYENIYVKNYFLRYGTSYYRYNSLADFFNNATPSSFAITFPVEGRSPFVELDFGQASLYAQDEIKVNDNFKLTVGLRADRPLFLNNLIPNNTIKALTFYDLNNNPFNMDVSQWPEERTYLSPRVGFNWDIKKDKSIIIRGGSGIFTGRFPFVWFTNQPSNSGTSVVPYEVSGAALSNYTFNPDPFFYVNSFPQSAGTPPLPSSIASVDRNFRMPQVFRTSLAVDKKLDENWTLTFEAIVNKDINAILQYNANQKLPIGYTAGAGARPLFGNTTATRRHNTGISEAMVLTNTNKGGAGIFTAQIARRFHKNWDFSVAYTHTQTFDLSGNPGAQASSAWSNLQSFRGNNDLSLAYSDFGTPNRVVAYASYRANWNKFLATTFTLLYLGYEQSRFSYIYSNDFNQDGVSRDLIYIPKDASEITFVQNGAFTPAQQSAAFFAFIDQDSYLSKRKGQFAERNGAKLPWFSMLDLRILQDIMPIAKHKNYGLQLSFEVENFTNLLNNDWGVSKRTVYDNGAILSVASAPTATTPATFRMNLVNGALPTTSYISNITVANTWRMNLGLRLNF